MGEVIRFVKSELEGGDHYMVALKEGDWKVVNGGFFALEITTRDTNDDDLPKEERSGAAQERGNCSVGLFVYKGSDPDSAEGMDIFEMTEPLNSADILRGREVDRQSFIDGSDPGDVAYGIMDMTILTQIVAENTRVELVLQTEPWYLEESTLRVEARFIYTHADGSSVTFTAYFDQDEGAVERVIPEAVKLPVPANQLKLPILDI